ncbi:Gx transporter family protein [Defluviitalea phaphyphila]|uniref:Gx transporter family protein n=1 Tax=Defluviitalea phaphyphila TaxID=1473580 RepID=UPI000730602F|nr:Gx transporter family protein [Defluviitalea phaphyphila]
MTNTKRIVLLSLLVGIALIIYVIEAQIPVIFPGVKLGLANIISLFTLLVLGWKESLIVVILRTVMGSIFGGSISAFLFSIVGGLLSNIVMILLYKFFRNYLGLSSISICGAIFHNIGQLLVAAFIIQDLRIYIYLPILLISGVITGYFVGISVGFIYKYFKNFPWIKDIQKGQN